MVGLRERKSRPSYAIIPDGLANLTDSEDAHSNKDTEEQGQDNIASGSGTGVRSSAKKPRKHVGSVSPQIHRGARKNDDDDDVSSGDSSAFAPSEKARAKDKGKKGKAKVGNGETSSDSEFEEGDDGGDAAEELKDLDSDEDQDLGSGGGEEEGSELDSEAERPTRRGKAKTSGARPTQASSKGKGKHPPASSEIRRSSKPMAAPPVYLQSDLNLVPPAYRQLIRSSTESMVKAQTTIQKLWGRDKTSKLDVDLFPSGNGLPFITRLNQPPGEGSEVKIEAAGDKGSRRKRAVVCDRDMSIGIGWEGWEGEGWWKEMYTAGEGSKGKGKGKMEGWKLRGEVRIGLDEVGRCGVDDLEFISEQDVHQYLPNAGTLNIHLGTHDDQTPVAMKLFEQVNMANYTTLKEGCVFNAGGPIWGMDWCPLPEEQAAHYDKKHYIAITTLPDADTKPSAGLKGPRDATSGIQIWSMILPDPKNNEPGRMKCEMILCVKGGPGMQCKWMPMGAWDDCDPENVDKRKLPKLGILAVLQIDGSVSFYNVPHPGAIRDSRRGKDIEVDSDQIRPLFLKCHDPILRIEVADAVGTCIDWLTGSKLAVGYSHGSVAIWDIAEALKTKQRADLLPDIYANMAQSSISALKVGRVPPSDSNGDPQFDQDPRFIIVSSWDGTMNMLDLRDPAHSVHLERSRLPCYSIGWSTQNQSPLVSDSDYNISIYKIKGIPAQRYICMASHRGPIWDIGSSDFHTMVATGGADGAVILSSTQQGFWRAKKTPLFFWRLLEIDYDEVTGHYRLTDDFIPETLMLEIAHGRKASKKAQANLNDPSAMKAGNWDPKVGIHRITWNEGSGLARAGMLAIGSASGLGIVQLVEPKWRPGTDAKKFV